MKQQRTLKQELPEAIGMKMCTKCKTVTDDFATHISGRLHSWCRQCKRHYDKVMIAKKRAGVVIK